MFCLTQIKLLLTLLINIDELSTVVCVVWNSNKVINIMEPSVTLTPCMPRILVVSALKTCTYEFVSG